MKVATPDIAKMTAEDSWLGSENAIQLLPIFMQSSDNVIVPPQICIEVAELETVEYEKSPALHCFLGTLYQSLPGELHEETKLMIEKLKLAKTGREHLLDYRNKPSFEITVSLPHQGKDFGENLNAATDYLVSCNIAAYMGLNNTSRAYEHFSKSLTLSGRNNPTVFQQLIKPITLLYMTPLLIINFQGDNPLINLFVDDYKAANLRVESKV
jgi:hypothetical protein